MTVAVPSLFNKFLDFPNENVFLSDLGVWALSLMVFVSGIVLLISAATPSITGRIKLLSEISAFPVMHFSSQNFHCHRPNALSAFLENQRKIKKSF